MAAHTLTLSALNARRLPDDNVFDRTLRGDPVAFSEVYRRYQKRIYGFCLARSLDPEAASDATQEVFMKLLRAQPGSIENPRAWLFAVARNVVIDVVRKRSRTPEDAGIEEDSLAWDSLRAVDTADEVLSRSDARNVFLALRTLRPRYRTALIMREVHGQSAKDMAEALETSPGAVDTLVSRARDAFGVAYAAVGDLPSVCRANVELIYRRTGTGITESEQDSLDAHLAECDHCRAESKRSDNPRHLAGLLPFLLPANTWAHGLLHRAAMTARTFPDVAVSQAVPAIAQPHTWNLATKIAAGLVAAALVTAPITAATISHRARPSASVSASSARTVAAIAPSDTAVTRGAAPHDRGTMARLTAPRAMTAMGIIMRSGGSHSGSTAMGRGGVTSAMPKRSNSGHRRGTGPTGSEQMGPAASGSGTMGPGSQGSGSSTRGSGPGTMGGGPGA